MTRFSFNPYHKLGFNLSPQSFRELIIEKQRRINEISNSILKAEYYLSNNPDSKPTIFRLANLKKDRIAVSYELVRAQHRLAEILKRMQKGS